MAKPASWEQTRGLLEELDTYPPLPEHIRTVQDLLDAIPDTAPDQAPEPDDPEAAGPEPETTR